jgi:hypothetical protein
MSDRIHELLNRNLQEVFGEGDAARRRAAIENSTLMIVFSMCLPAFRRARRIGQALRGGWSVWQLDRQVSSLVYERIALSKNKGGEAGEG